MTAMREPKRLRRSAVASWLAAAALLGASLAASGVREPAHPAHVIEVRVGDRLVSVPGPRVRVTAALRTAGIAPRDGELLSVRHDVIDRHPHHATRPAPLSSLRGGQPGPARPASTIVR